jgi:hypothetical protein
MAYGTVNADVIGTSITGSNLGAGNASIMKNRIINGAMVIDQRNAGSSVTATGNIYTLDRWRAYGNVDAKYTIQQNAGSVTPPVGFSKYLGVTSSSAYSVGSGDYFFLTQRIEGFNIADFNFGSANAKTITLSFWVYSSLTGTFGGSLANGAQDRSYPFTYTISSANTWTQISITISGCTTGTWSVSNTSGLELNIGLGVGSTLSGTANGTWQSADYRSATGAVSVVGTSGATFYITGVQLEVGSSATGYEYRQYTNELSLCQRYYEVLYPTGTVTTGYSNTSVQLQSFSFATAKRAAPTFTTNASGLTATFGPSGSQVATFTLGAGSYLSGSGTWVASSTSVSSARCGCNAASTFTNCSNSTFFSEFGSTVQFNFSAEL